MTSNAAAGGATAVAPARKTSALDYLYFMVVGAYLSVTMVYLVLTKRLDPGVSLRRLIRGAMQRKMRGDLAEIHSEQGFCAISTIPPGPVSDMEGRSRIMVYENGQPLGPAHCSHDEIRRHGGGRFSHWGGSIYFSASDNSDPRTNGRKYTFAEV